MLLSLAKILVFVLLVTAITLSGAWLMEQPGGATVAVGGYEVTLTPLQLALGEIAILILFWLLLWVMGLLGAVFRFINGDNNALSNLFGQRRHKRGMDELAGAAVALASGDGALALARAEAAKRHLQAPELTTLLVAQAAEMAGDRARSEAAWVTLARHERTRFAGLRGLLRQKLDQGDNLTALRLAERAFELRPEHRETQDLLLRLQAESHDWAGARTTLGAQKRSGSLPKDVHRRRDAVLALGQAVDVMDETLPIEARERAIEANRLSPDLVPAAVIAARTYLAAGQPKYAVRVLRKAWEAEPHPDLAAAFAEIAPAEAPEARLRRFEALTALHPEHPETRMLRAELLIAAEDFAGARRALGDLVERAPTGRSMTLMAAIARGQGEDEAAVRGWLARALAAPRGPQWVCDNCGRIHGAWGPVCSNCHGFDTLSWKVPPAEATLPGGTEMLPLLVGAPAATPAATTAVEPATVVRTTVVTTSPQASTSPADAGPAPPGAAPAALAPRRN